MLATPGLPVFAGISFQAAQVLTAVAVGVDEFPPCDTTEFVEVQNSGCPASSSQSVLPLIPAPLHDGCVLPQKLCFTGGALLPQSLQLYPNSLDSVISTCLVQLRIRVSHTFMQAHFLLISTSQHSRL